VSDADDRGDDLEGSIAAVYRGPLEEFVARRDALVKELRAASRRDDADTVKRLRKPTRTAWALDAAALDDPVTVETLVDRVATMVEAQSGQGDLRQAADQLRRAVHDYAAAAARAATDAGHPVDPSLLAPAVMAVIGSVDQFEALRAGRLVDVPTGGGLDLLTGTLPMPRPSGARPVPVPAEPEPAPDSTAVATARQALAQADAAESTARDRAEAADRAAAAAEAESEAAEERLRQAEQDARDVRRELRQAQQEAKAARQQLRDKTAAAAKARARLTRLTG
jgi:hypothetical protein